MDKPALVVALVAVARATSSQEAATWSRRTSDILKECVFITLGCEKGIEVVALVTNFGRRHSMHLLGCVEADVRERILITFPPLKTTQYISRIWQSFRQKLTNLCQHNLINFKWFRSESCQNLQTFYFMVHLNIKQPFPVHFTRRLGTSESNYLIDNSLRSVSEGVDNSAAGSAANNSQTIYFLSADQLWSIMENKRFRAWTWANRRISSK